MSWTLKSDEATTQLETRLIRIGRSASGVGVGRSRSVILFEKFQLFYILSIIIFLSPTPSAPMMTMIEPITPEMRKTGSPEQEQVDFEKSNEQRYLELTPNPWVEPKPDFDDNSPQIFSEGGLKSDNLNSVVESAAAAEALQNNHRLSRAFERIHFGPWLKKFRPITNRAVSNTPNHGGGGSESGSDSHSLMTDYTPRRRVSFPHSGESFPVPRFSRPIMRLRWGK